MKILFSLRSLSVASKYVEVVSSERWRIRDEEYASGDSRKVHRGDSRCSFSDNLSFPHWVNRKRNRKSAKNSINFFRFST